MTLDFTTPEGQEEVNRAVVVALKWEQSSEHPKWWRRPEDPPNAYMWELPDWASDPGRAFADLWPEIEAELRIVAEEEATDFTIDACLTSHVGPGGTTYSFGVKYGEGVVYVVEEEAYSTAQEAIIRAFLALAEGRE